MIVEYVWIGGGDNPMNQTLRSKTRYLPNLKGFISIKTDTNEDYFTRILQCIPAWNYDGSSTNQATGQDSEIILKPCAVFKDPFREKNGGLLVLCDTYTSNNERVFNNNRVLATDVFNRFIEEEPWFGLEQEYFIINKTTNLPLGFPDNYPEKVPNPQGQYYCSVGSTNAYGRDIVEEHFTACLYAGICVSGINAEVAPGQWEFQVGPCTGIESGDHLWMARYLLLRVAEKYNVIITFEPKPVKGDWNGSGCHMNYSTKNMRHGTEDRTGLEYIEDAIDKLSKKHKEHMDIYGSGNEERMTGLHETASFTNFTDGICNRGASIRRGTDTVKNKKGYFEDRRPSSNCDPYLITAKMCETTLPAFS